MQTIIHHYTNIETLSLILKNRTLRFNRLDRVDDPEESNFIEHKVIVIRDGEMTYDNYQLQISKRELEINTIRLAQLVRCAIIYLCNFVMHAEYDKKERL